MEERTYNEIELKIEKATIQYCLNLIKRLPIEKAIVSLENQLIPESSTEE